ncbi:MAG: HEAT repeat domain-containing protein [Candidatus Riflebacteria bacterium]|nr:HEAT repeat domain-containing protein [Candidatus Riflebacteria bacterium]
MDLMPDVIQSLSAPIKSFRIFAIEKAIYEGSSKELLDVLRARQLEETDEECLILLSHAVLAVVNRISETHKNFLSTPIESFHEKFVLSSSEDKLSILKSLSQNEIISQIPCVTQLLARESNPLVLSSIIRLFGRHWPKDKLPELCGMLLSNFLSVRLASLEILSCNYPDCLINDLPRLLSSDDPRIRAMAIQGLAKIDLEIAIEHLEAMLMGENLQEKLCGVQNCLYLPFEKVKSLLLKFLASETSNDLIIKAGAVLEINPDKEVPFRLLEIISQSSNDQKDLLRKIFVGSCKSIKNSGILGQNYDLYMNRLHNFELKLNANRIVQSVLSKHNVAVSETEISEELAYLLRTNRPEILTSLRESLQWNISELLKKVVRDALAGIEVDLPDESSKIQSEKNAIESLNPDEIIRVVSSWQILEREQVTPIIKNILQNHNTSDELRSVVLKAALRLNLDGFIPLAEPFLKHHDEKLMVAALEYVARFNPDRIFPLLGFYLQSSGIRTKSSAISILKEFDPGRALATVSLMLSSVNREHHKIAFSCMVRFDFPLVKSILIDFLLKNNDSEMLDMGLCLFQTNPDIESLYDLFRLEKKISSEFQKKVEIARNRVEKELIEIGLLNDNQRAEFVASFENRFNLQEAKLKEAPKPYSLKKTRRSTLQDAGQTTFFSGFQELYYKFRFFAEQSIGAEWKMVVLMIVLVIVSFIILLYSVFSGSDISKVKLQGGPMIAKKKTLIAEVVEVEKKSGVVFLRTDDGNKVLLLSNPKIKIKLSVGDLVRATISPIRMSNKGVIIVQEYEIEKIKFGAKDANFKR